MTREIKFRAWDSLDRKMAYDIIKTKELSNIDGGYDVIGFDSYLNDGLGTIVMQFTGLTDSLGKECWEGDKVKCTHPNSTHHGFVKYFDEFACYGIADENGKYICSLGAFAGDGFKVMGNIYENPELLEI